MNIPKKKKKKKKEDVRNGTSSRHLALVIGWIWPPRCGVDQSEATGSGRGGAPCIAALTHLTLHHHLPGNTGDLAVHHRTWNPRPERETRILFKRFSALNCNKRVERADEIFNMVSESDTH